MYTADRERGITMGTARIMPETASFRKKSAATMNFMPGPDDDVVYCTNSAGGSFTASNAAPPAACAELDEIQSNGAGAISWDGASWGDDLAEFCFDTSESKPPKKKSDLEHLLIDMDVPTLESLLM